MQTDVCCICGDPVRVAPGEEDVVCRDCYEANFKGGLVWERPRWRISPTSSRCAGGSCRPWTVRAGPDAGPRRGREGRSPLCLPHPPTATGRWRSVYSANASVLR